MHPTADLKTSLQTRQTETIQDTYRYRSSLVGSRYHERSDFQATVLSLKSPQYPRAVVSSVISIDPSFYSNLVKLNLIIRLNWGLKSKLKVGLKHETFSISIDLIRFKNRHLPELITVSILTSAMFRHDRHPTGAPWRDQHFLTSYQESQIKNQ